MQPILAQRLPQLAEILKAHRVKRAYAFGSVCTESCNSQFLLLRTCAQHTVIKPYF